MLGLTSHEPHFALLREEVRFGKQSKRITKAEQQTFHLLHLSLLREYLEFEFGVLKVLIIRKNTLSGEILALRKFGVIQAPK